MHIRYYAKILFQQYIMLTLLHKPPLMIVIIFYREIYNLLTNNNPLKFKHVTLLKQQKASQSHLASLDMPKQQAWNHEDIIKFFKGHMYIM